MMKYEPGIVDSVLDLSVKKERERAELLVYEDGVFST